MEESTRTIGSATATVLAKVREATKVQFLLRLSLQKGYVCIPRSGSTSKIERMAIAQNSHGGVNDLVKDIGGQHSLWAKRRCRCWTSLMLVASLGSLDGEMGWAMRVL
mmetsp:Transcript_16985/g.36831  ORF Transcript_16985/g.36831 Transcript_16985/m.36831 type:complete len:108 (-) Transcript_16985:2264-2587(-)